MRCRDSLIRVFTLLAAPCLCAPAGFAQNVHLNVLRDWLDKTEEAARFVSRGDYASAEERLAIKEIRPYLPETRRIMSRSYCELAKVLYLQKRYADAEPLARWALSVRDSDQEAKPDAVFQSVYALAMILSAQKKYPESETLFKRALAMQEKNLGENHVNSSLILKQLANVQLAQAKYSDAESLYRRAISIHERKTPDQNLDLADTAEQYAGLLRRMKRPEEADQWHARALAIRDAVATKAAKARADQVNPQFRGYQ
jgi:tetratricopeptide (TPR) repeat protein